MIPDKLDADTHTLEPCPFCGGDARVVLDFFDALVVKDGKSKDHLVECRQCGALGPSARSKT